MVLLFQLMGVGFVDDNVSPEIDITRSRRRAGLLEFTVYCIQNILE